MKRIFKIFPLLACSTLLFACGGRQPAYKDGDSYDISVKGNGSIKATLHKIKGGFNLTVSGKGVTKNFKSADKVPWHYISKRITSLTIKNGITTIGNYLFYSLTSVQGCVLPASLTTIGTDGFNEDFELYSISETGVQNYSSATIYTYQENAPDVSDVYWHYKNGVPTVWSTVRMLFVCNSFTYYYDIPKIVEGLAKSLNEMIAVEYVTKGSATLDDHSDHTSETGTQIYAKLSARNDYDYVILQEQSTRPVGNYNSFKTAAESLAKDVKNTQKKCEVRLYSTWGYADAADPLHITIPDYEKLLRDAYIKCANEVANIDDVNFVGPAFTEVFSNTKYQNINLYYSKDNKHPSTYGAYLSACVHVLSLFKGIDIDSTDFFGTKVGQYVNSVDPGAQGPVDFGTGISEQDARALIKVAKETVKKYSINVDDDTEHE